jgi:hypothetical protein
VDFESFQNMLVNGGPEDRGGSLRVEYSYIPLFPEFLDYEAGKKFPYSI